MPSSDRLPANLIRSSTGRALAWLIDVERLRLACGSTQLLSRVDQGPPLKSNGGAPPRIWTFLSRLRAWLVDGNSVDGSAHLVQIEGLGHRGSAHPVEKAL